MAYSIHEGAAAERSIAKALIDYRKNETP